MTRLRFWVLGDWLADTFVIPILKIKYLKKQSSEDCITVFKASLFYGYSVVKTYCMVFNLGELCLHLTSIDFAGAKSNDIE